MYGDNPPTGPPPAAPTVDLDDLFGVKPAPPPPQQPPPPSLGYAGGYPNGGGGHTSSTDLPPPPPYWEDGGHGTNGGGATSYSTFQTNVSGGPPQGQGSDSGSGYYPSPAPASPPHSAAGSTPSPSAGYGSNAGMLSGGYATTAAASAQGYGAVGSYAGSPYGVPQQLQQPPQTPPAPPPRSQEDEDREQLEKIIRLRKELEAEQRKEQEKKLELETWGCPECTYRNKLNTTACEMCGTGRPGYTPAPTVGGSGGGPAAPVRPSAAPTAWQCGLCLAPNEASDARCRVCSGFRSNALPAQQAPPSSSSASPGAIHSSGSGVQSRTPFHTDWTCSICGKTNAPSKANCTVCNSYQYNGTPVAAGGGAVKRAEPEVEATPTTWQCSVCTLENKVKDAVCVACQSGQRPRHLAKAAAPKKVSFQPRLSASESSPGPSGGRSGDGAQKKRKWPCPQCTFLNSVRRSKCDMCSAPRPEKFAPAPGDKETAKKEKKREEASDEDEVQWQDDEVARACNRCHQEFSFMRRRHHCRACGYVFCAVCSPFYLVLKKDTEPQRVCVNCYEARGGKDK